MFICGVSSPSFPLGGLAMPGIQLGDCDLILQEPVPARMTGVDGRRDGWMEGAGGGAARMEGDFMLLLSVDNHRH